MELSEIKWKEAKGFEGYYAVSECGLIKSLDREYFNSLGVKRKVKGKILNPRKNRGGYYQVNLSCDTKRKTFEVHRLIALTFLKEVESKSIVDHIDNNKENNSISNLMFVDARTNVSKDVKNKTSKYTGVSLCNQTNKWIASISKKRVYVRFKRTDDEELARLYYETALENIDKYDINNKKEFKDYIVGLVNSK